VLQAVERRIERALLDLQRPAGDLPDPQQHAVAVQLAERDGLEDEQSRVPGRTPAWSFIAFS
jgi:hypothetical protein